jgi:hypothetical protein
VEINYWLKIMSGIPGYRFFYFTGADRILRASDQAAYFIYLVKHLKCPHYEANLYSPVCFITIVLGRCFRTDGDAFH